MSTSSPVKFTTTVGNRANRAPIHPSPTVSSTPRGAVASSDAAASAVGYEPLSHGYEDFRHGDSTTFLMHTTWHDATYLTLLLPETTASVRIDARGMCISVKSRTKPTEWHHNVTHDHCGECPGFYYRHRCEHQAIADRAEDIAQAWQARRDVAARQRAFNDAMDMARWEEVA